MPHVAAFAFAAMTGAAGAQAAERAVAPDSTACPEAIVDIAACSVAKHKTGAYLPCRRPGMATSSCSPVAVAFTADRDRQQSRPQQVFPCGPARLCLGRVEPPARGLWRRHGGRRFQNASPIAQACPQISSSSRSPDPATRTAPASRVIAPPSNAATTSRPSPGEISATPDRHRGAPRNSETSLRHNDQSLSRRPDALLKVRNPR
jgi:hypothetical protein